MKFIDIVMQEAVNAMTYMGATLLFLTIVYYYIAHDVTAWNMSLYPYYTLGFFLGSVVVKYFIERD